MARSLNVSHYMVKFPVSVSADTTVLSAAKTILEAQVSGVCVVDDDNNLLGVLSELDCLRAIVEEVFEKGQSSAGIVADAMTKEVETNREDDQIINVAASMLDHKHRRRPIVENGKLKGQVTCRQILKAIKDFAAPEDPRENA